jgi:hypothetical protein
MDQGAEEMNKRNLILVALIAVSMITGICRRTIEGEQINHIQHKQ